MHVMYVIALFTVEVVVLTDCYVTPIASVALDASDLSRGP